ncbi:uncharacterized protein LOC143247705 [Tachypleus tridentatus]|uniref:uncharacterized protein LOC143247705 n=1 Tax=Tachypleus tridentatus TaxID=6853 RepID=UPI003FD26208
MGCCGCSLFAFTVIAAVFALFHSVFGLSWSTYALILIKNPELVENIWNVTDTFNQKFVSSFEALEENDVDVIIIIAAVTLNSLWFLCSVFLLCGNSANHRCILLMWMTVLTLTIFANISGSGYYGYRLKDHIDDLVKNNDKESIEERTWQKINENLSIFYILVCFCISAIPLPFQICFLIGVDKRQTQIRKNRTEVRNVQRMLAPPSRFIRPGQSQHTNFHQHNRPPYDEVEMRPHNPLYPRNDYQANTSHRNVEFDQDYDPRGWNNQGYASDRDTRW